jgi:Tfp pilus assembly protein PilF
MVLETLMRFTPPAIALAVLFTMVSSVGQSQQRRDVPVDPRSTVLQKQGEAAAAAGNLNAANDALETALAVDPRNRGAFLALAGVASRQNLYGKSIRLYREALLIEPNDINALAGQGEAMAAKGALGKARENLAKVSSLCVSKCPQLDRLTAAIARGPLVTAQVTPPVAKTLPQ